MFIWEIIGLKNLFSKQDCRGKYRTLSHYSPWVEKFMACYILGDSCNEENNKVCWYGTCFSLRRDYQNQPSVYSMELWDVQYIPRNMHTVFVLLCFVVVIHWLIFPYRTGLLHWHCGNLTIAPVPAKQPWWIWINTSCEFIMNDCITTTKQSTTKRCAYFLGYTVVTDSPNSMAV